MAACIILDGGIKIIEKNISSPKYNNCCMVHRAYPFVQFVFTTTLSFGRRKNCIVNIRVSLIGYKSNSEL